MLCSAIIHIQFPSLNLSLWPFNHLQVDQRSPPLPCSLSVLLVVALPCRMLQVTINFWTQDISGLQHSPWQYTSERCFASTWNVSRLIWWNRYFSTLPVVWRIYKDYWTDRRATWASMHLISIPPCRNLYQHVENPRNSPLSASVRVAREILFGLLKISTADWRAYWRYYLLPFVFLSARSWCPPLIEQSACFLPSRIHSGSMRSHLSFRTCFPKFVPGFEHEKCADLTSILSSHADLSFTSDPRASVSNAPCSRFPWVN